MIDLAFCVLAQGAWLKAKENLIITGQTEFDSYRPPRYIITMPSHFDAGRETPAAAYAVHPRRLISDRGSDNAPSAAIRAAVGDVKLATAVAAAKNTGKQGLAAGAVVSIEARRGELFLTVAVVI